MFRALTVAREFGCGGGRIAQLAAQRLGWKLLDNNLIIEIARAVSVDAELARKYDERVDSWAHRISRRSLWHGVFEGVAAVGEAELFDCQTMATLATSLIQEAYKQGDCVIVGRGAQCILQQKQDVFHVYIYGPWHEKVERVRRRLPPGTDLEALIRATDEMRAEYVTFHYGCQRDDPHLYHMMISSALGEEVAVDAILRGMGLPAQTEPVS